MTLTYDEVVDACSRRPRAPARRGDARGRARDRHARRPRPAEPAERGADGPAARRSSAALAADPAIRAIVLTGRDPAFSAGGDLRLMVDVGQRQLREAPGGATEIWRWIRGQFGGIARLITRTDKAFIAAVNGPAAGVGLAFALACDMRAALRTGADRAGVRADRAAARGRQQLAADPSPRATSGRSACSPPVAICPGAEAFELGLGNEVVAHEQLLAGAGAWCERIETLPEHVLAMSKPLLRQCADLTWEQAIAMEEFAEPMCFTTQAHRDRVAELLGREA